MKKKLFVFLGFVSCFLFGWLSAYAATQGIVNPPPEKSLLVEENSLLDVKVMYGYKSVIGDNHNVISYEGTLYFPEEVFSGLGYDSAYNETSGVISFVPSDSDKLDQIPMQEALLPKPDVSTVVPDPEATTQLLSAGQYVVGDDIPAGKYDVTARSGMGNFMGDVASLGTFGLNQILDASGEFGSVSYSNLRLEFGDVIEIRGDLQIRMDPK